MLETEAYQVLVMQSLLIQLLRKRISAYLFRYVILPSSAVQQNNI